MAIAETPVRLPSPPLPRGFRAAGAHAGLKRNPSREDIALVVSDLPATAAGVYTTNLVFAAPVELDRGRIRPVRRVGPLDAQTFGQRLLQPRAI